MDPSSFGILGHNKLSAKLSLSGPCICQSTVMDPGFPVGGGGH